MKRSPPATRHLPTISHRKRTLEEVTPNVEKRLEGERERERKSDMVHVSSQRIEASK